SLSLADLLLVWPLGCLRSPLFPYTTLFRSAFGYDSLHRLTSDTVSTASGAQAAAIGYGYDNNNDVTSMTTSGLAAAGGAGTVSKDRKSTRLNSSHGSISYAVFCLKKKKQHN